MKENNKFSLSAFFCSLGSKSKLSKFVLLGAPFVLVYFFTLNVYASAISVPITDGLVTNPTGGVTSPIHNVLKMDTGSINSSLWVALGLDPLDLADIISDANEAYQDGNQVVYDAIIESLNEIDSGSGDLLDYVIQSTYQASSQSGYMGKISIPDDVWTRVNKATKNGLSISIASNNSSNLSYNDFISYVTSKYNITSNQFPSSSYESPVIEFVISGQGLFCFGTNTYTYENNTLTIQGGSSMAYEYDGGLYFWQNPNRIFNNVSSVQVIGGSISKHIGIAQDFISNKANENYDIVSKSSTYDPDTGKIVGARSINLITPAYLEELVASIRESIISIPEALQRLGIGAIDTDQAIPIGIGFDINTLSEVVAQSVPQEATAAATREAFLQLDNFQFYTPDDFVGIPSVAPIPVAMNWIAVQMQTIMKLTSFQNCWVILSSLAVLGLIVGLVRLSK